MKRARPATKIGVLLALCLIPPLTTWAAPHDVIICGIGGEESYRLRFADWGRRLQRVLTEDLNHPAANVHLLLESGGNDLSSALPTNLENIRKVLAAVGREISPDEDLFVYLIGHGSYFREISKFHIPDRDLTTGALSEMLSAIPARRLIVVNSTQSSAGFINELSGRARIITTATKSTEESNATEFMEYFLQSLEEGSADQNRDERISILEVCSQAASLTAAWFIGEGLIATEHALLDDNGDKRGSRLPLGLIPIGLDSDFDDEFTSEVDGELAAVCFLKDFSFPDWVPQDLVDSYLLKLDAVESIKRTKSNLNGDDYYAGLETLLIEASRINREIRRLSASPPDQEEATPSESSGLR